jgi:hypothetical protein
LVANNFTEFLLKVLQIKPTADGKVTEEEIKAIIKEGRRRRNSRN